MMSKFFARNIPLRNNGGADWPPRTLDCHSDEVLNQAEPADAVPLGANTANSAERPRADQSPPTPSCAHTPLPLDWGEADIAMLGSHGRCPPAFPLNAFDPFWAESIAGIAQSRSAPVDYVATALLTSAGALLGNVRWVRAGADWTEPPILWVCNVGSPGSGKSPAQDAVAGLLRYGEEILAQGYDEELRRWRGEQTVAKAEIADWEIKVKAAVKDGSQKPPRPRVHHSSRPERPRVQIADVTVEKVGQLASSLPRGLMVVRDEISGWLGGFDKYGGGGSDRAFWLEAFGGRPYSIDRVKHDESIRIPRLSVAVLGGIQPDKLNKIIGGADDGFAARFLYAWPDRSPGFRLMRERLDLRPARDAMGRLAHLTMASGSEPSPVIVPLNRDAEDCLEAFGRETVAGSEKILAGPMAAVHDKARGHALRLALILEFLWWCGGETGEKEPATISRQAMEAAIALVRGYFIPMAGRVFGDASIPREERLAMALVRYLQQRRAMSFNARDVRRELGGILRDADAVATACRMLAEANLIRSASDHHSSRAGRPRLDYEVNPVIFAGNTTSAG